MAKPVLSQQLSCEGSRARLAEKAKVLPEQGGGLLYELLLLGQEREEGVEWMLSRMDV